MLAKFPKSNYTLTSRGHVYLGKGDLDAALKDYNEAIKINPNYIRAHAARGQLYEKRKDLAAARADYRAASATLTRFDDIDTGIARRLAKERLAVLMAAVQAPPGAASAKPAPGKTAAPPPPSGPRKVALIVGNGAYKNVTPLDNPPRDAKLIADTLRGRRLSDRDAGAAISPATSSSQPCTRSAPRPRRPIGRWSITPATASRSAASII